MSADRKVLNEFHLVQKVLMELESTDEAFFSIGRTTRTLPFEGTVFDAEGNEYKLEGKDSSVAFAALIKKHKLTYSVLVPEKQIKFSGPQMTTINIPASDGA